MEPIECSKCGAIFEKTGAKDKLRRFKDKRFMTTFHCPNCDARVILKNNEEPVTIYLKRLERLKEQAKRLGDNQEVNELQNEIDQINREIKMNAGKTKDKKFSVKGKDEGYDAKDDVNYLGEKVFHTYESWKVACKRVNPNVVFEGNRDICEAKPGVGQWDGVTGVIYKTDDEAYDPTTPKNILKEKELAKARGVAAADEKIISINTPKWSGDIKIVDNTHFEMKAEGTNKWSWAYHIGQADDHILNALKAKGMLKDNGRFFITDSLFKGQKVTAIKSEQGLREGETYTVLGEEAIIKQVVGEGNTIVYKLQDSSGNVIVIESPEGLFYEVKDSKTKDKYELVWQNSKFEIYEDENNEFELVRKSNKAIIGQYATIQGAKLDAQNSWQDDWKSGKLDNGTKDPEDENESLKVKIGDIRKNMDAARKMGYDTEPYQKEIDKLETKDEWTEEEIKKRMKRISEEIDKIVLSGGVVGLGDPLSIEYGRLKSKLKNKTKDDNSKNGYYAAMTGKARTDNPFPKGTPENQKWDSDWKIGSEDFKYESNKELFKPKDSDDKELKEMLVNDAPDYYGAIVATARRGNNPQMGSKEIRKNLEPFMSSHGVQFNEEEFNKAYKEFNKAGVSKAAFMKGTDADDIYTKDPLTKKGEKILAAMKKAYGEEKGEQIFYASRNKGKISGVDSKTKDGADLYCPNCGERIGKMSEVEGNAKAGGCRSGEQIKLGCPTCGKGFTHVCKYNTISNTKLNTKQPTTREEAIRQLKEMIKDSKTKDDNLPADYLDKLEKEIRDIIKANGDKEKAKKLLHELENTGANKFPDLHKALDADYKIKECPNCKNQLTYSGEENGKIKYECKLCGKKYTSKDSKTKDGERPPDEAIKKYAPQAPSYLRKHPMWSPVDYAYFRYKGTPDEQIKAYWDRDVRSGKWPVTWGDSKTKDQKIDKKFIASCPACQEMRAAGLSYEETHSSHTPGMILVEVNGREKEIPNPHITKDQEIKIIIGDDPVNPSPAEQKVEGNDVIYKEYTLKQLPETGEFEIYAPGGSIVGHAKALELAKLFVDRIVVSRVGDEWSEEARKKL